MVRRRVVLSQCLTRMPMLLAGVVLLATLGPIAPRARGAETVVIPSEPIKIKPGSPLSGRALVQRPASINGLMSWTLETRRHRGVIYHVAISPDGKTLATGGLDGTIRLWEVETGKFIKCLLGHNSYVFRLAWSPDGNTLASAGAYDGSVGLWDVKTGVLRRAIRSPHGVVTYVAWAPNGTQLAFATGGSGHMLVYDVVRGEYINNDKEKDVALGTGITALEWSPDGQVVGFMGATTPVSLWQLSAVRQNKFLLTEEAVGSPLYSVSFSRDGKEVAVGSLKTIRIYNFETEKLTRTTEAAAYSVAYSPDGKMLASAPQNGVVQLWEADTGKLIKTLTGSATSSLSWSADSKLLATTTYTTAVVWDVETAKPKQTFDACGINPPIWVPKMPFITGVATNTPSVCDPASGKVQCKLEGHTAPVYSFAWSRDGKTLATGGADATVRLWEMPSGTPLATYKGHTAFVHAIAWMSDSKSLASASSDKTIRVWKVPEKKPAASKKADEDKTSTEAATTETKSTTDATKKAVGKKDAKDPQDLLIQEFKGHAGPVTQLAAPSVGPKLLVSGSTDKTIKVWNLTSNKLATTIDIGYPIQALAWSPDGKVLCSSSVDERLSYWNAATGKLLKDTGKSGNVPTMSSMTFSPNSSLIAVGYRGGHVLSLRDVQSDKVVHSLTAMAPVNSATWTLSGQSVAAGCEDRTVRFWDIAKGELRGHLIAEEGQVAAVSADGHFKAEPGIEADLFYVAQTDKSQETLSISEFAAKAKWKNNPALAAVIGK